MQLHIRTPLLESGPLSRAAGRSIWIKPEALQPPGSFKIRGVGFACIEYVRRGAKRFVSSSGGNAGIAAAYAGRRLGVPVTVVVPETTSARAKELLGQENAHVIIHGSSWQEANAHAQSLIDGTSAFIHPFDDPLLWQGHASLVDEIVADGFAFDVVVLSVGGGGLLCGVVEGLLRNNLGHVPIVAVETEGAASLYKSMAAGKRIVLDSIATVATSLGAKQVSEQTFAYAQSQDIRSVLVSDRDAVWACKDFLSDHRMLVEPACGAALALAYKGAKELADFSKVVIIACGGVTTTVEQLNTWVKEFS